jgi:hypothetical protein
MMTASTEAEDDRLRPLDLRSVFATQPPPLDFVLPGLVAGTTGVLVASGGTGKSMLSLQTAVSIACGRDLFGIWGENPAKGRVVIMAVEDTKAVLERRLHGIGKAIPPECLDDVVDGLDILPGFGRGFSIASLTPEGVVQSVPMAQFVESLADRAPRLTVFDTFNRCLGGISENESGPMGAVLSVVEAMCLKVGCASLIVHHTNKASAASGTASEQQAARGSSAITDNARWQVNLSTMTKDEAATRCIEDDGIRRSWVRLDLSKVNYGPPIAERWLHRIDGGVLTGKHGGLPEKEARRGGQISSGRRPRRDIDDE